MDPIEPILPSQFGIPRIERAPAAPPVKREAREQTGRDSGPRRQPHEDAPEDPDEDMLDEGAGRDRRRDLGTPDPGEPEARDGDDEPPSGPHIDILA